MKVYTVLRLICVSLIFALTACQQLSQASSPFASVVNDYLGAFQASNWQKAWSDLMTPKQVSDLCVFLVSWRGHPFADLDQYAQGAAESISTNGGLVSWNIDAIKTEHIARTGGGFDIGYVNVFRTFGSGYKGKVQFKVMPDENGNEKICAIDEIAY